MKAERLLSILLLLQNNGKLTTKELAHRLEVSPRTILRDMEDLSSAGIPIYAERGANGGWRLSEGYQTRLTGMKAEEIQALILNHSSTLLTGLGIKQNLEAAFQKLLAAIPGQMQKDIDLVRTRIHIDGAGWHQSKEAFKHLSIVQEAVWQEKKLYIKYQRGQDMIERVVCPLGLIAMKSIWYMAAQVDHGDPAYLEDESGAIPEDQKTENLLRSYRISRIAEAKLLDQTFSRPPNFNLAEFWETSTKQFKAALPRYPARVVTNSKTLQHLAKMMFVQVLHVAELNEKESGVEAELQFNTLESAVEIILGLHTQIKVLEPLELQNEVQSKARAILSLYETVD